MRIFRHSSNTTGLSTAKQTRFKMYANLLFSVRLVLNVIYHTGILYPQHDPTLPFSSMHLFN